MSGSISGRITERVTAVGLAMAPVTAQTIDSGGVTSIVRSTVTDANGAYVLDLLPVGQSYFVVTQPVLGISVFGAAASGPLALTPVEPVMGWAGSVMVATRFGVVYGMAEPTEVDHVDRVELLQTFSIGGMNPELIVRSQGVDAGGGYRFEFVPEGTYVVLLTRTLLDAEGTAYATLRFRSSADVASGGVLRVSVGRL